MEINKNDQVFEFQQAIPETMGLIHNRLQQQDFLRGQSAQEFAQNAGQVIGDVNYVHPFREGNGRTQAIYLQQLGQQAGHEIDLSRLSRDEWIQASIEAHDTRYDRMAGAISQAIVEPGAQATSEPSIEASSEPSAQQSYESDISSAREAYQASQAGMEQSPDRGQED